MPCAVFSLNSPRELKPEPGVRPRPPVAVSYTPFDIPFFSLGLYRAFSPTPGLTFTPSKRLPTRAKSPWAYCLHTLPFLSYALVGS